MSEYGEPWEARERTTDSPCSNASIFIQGDSAGEFDPPGTWLKVESFRAHETGLDAGALADRVIACVNFLEGVPTERLEKLTGDDPVWSGLNKLVRGYLKDWEPPPQS